MRIANETRFKRDTLLAFVLFCQRFLEGLGVVIKEIVV